MRERERERERERDDIPWMISWRLHGHLYDNFGGNAKNKSTYKTERDKRW